jgi:hypothetical protein
MKYEMGYTDIVNRFTPIALVDLSMRIRRNLRLSR